VRGTALIVPRGQTEMLPGDHVFVFCRPDDRPFLQLMFGKLEETEDVSEEEETAETERP
jgi:cell volume regulation protein A